MAEDKEKRPEQAQGIERYADIIDLPHHVSSVRAHMSLSDRAAQFAPFAALTGYDEIIDDTTHRAVEKALAEDAVPFEDLQ